MEGYVIEGYVIEVPAGSDWVLESSRTFAALEITLDSVDCDVPPVVDPPATGDDTPGTKLDTDELAKTGSDQSLTERHQWEGIHLFTDG